MTQSAEWVYLLIEREFLKTKESIYKIGRTDDWDSRVKQYPKGSALLGLVHVCDSVLAERSIIATFKQQFVARRDVGREYFEGEHQAILTTFFATATKFIANQCPGFSMLTSLTGPLRRSVNDEVADDDDDEVVINLGEALNEEVGVDAGRSGTSIYKDENKDDNIEDAKDAPTSPHDDGVTNDFDLNIWRFVTSMREALEDGPILLQTFYNEYLKWLSMQPRRDNPRKHQGRGTLLQARSSIKMQFGVLAETSKDGIMLRFDLQRGKHSTNPVEEWFNMNYELTGSQRDNVSIDKTYKEFVAAHPQHNAMSKKLFGILMKRIDLSSKVVAGNYRAYTGVRQKISPMIG